jgi:hypothetical protein
MAKRFQLFIVSVDFDTTLRQPPYPQLDTFLSTLGGVLKPTHQIRLLPSPFTASKIRTDIRNHFLQAGGIGSMSGKSQGVLLRQHPEINASC